MERMEASGLLLMGLGILLLVGMAMSAFLGEIITPTTVPFTSRLMPAGYALVLAGLLLLLAYVIIDRRRQMKEDNLGDHTRY